jgi:type I restriction enzyme S subunit
MSKIEELIEKLCPDGVEYKTLEELFIIKNGYTPSKSKPEYWANGTIPWFRMEDIRANGRILSDSIQHITPEAIKGSKLFPANSIIVATTATIGEHALIIVDSLANQQFTFLSKRESLEKPLNIKFFYYYMFIIDKWCKEHVNNGGFASVDMTAFKKVLVPVPPLEIQEKIVEILDNFSSLTAELQAELQARKSQYEFYRNQLLTFDREDADTSSLQSDVSSSSLQNGNNPNTQNTQGNCRVTTTIRKPRKVKWMKLGDACSHLK